ncbi:MAG: DUF11 domain-containing protein [Opitutales bacterium]|nr:DUF11 domain-containing protein [Opitutales bacterium]MCH8540287.1 DUF11 domain-containing protein [Opitutales bacterium]
MKKPHAKRHSFGSVIVAVLALFLGSVAASAAPLAGTPIGNQAKATYTDDSGIEREVFSNTVVTLVAEIYGLTLLDDQSKNAGPGTIVYFSHTVINDGNAPDTFDLSAINAGGDFNLSNIEIYTDSNQDGLPDNFSNISATSELAPGEEFHFVVAGNLPPGATIGQDAVLTVTATSQAEVTLLETNTDTVTATDGAVMQVTKSINQSSGAPGSGPYTYTITYTNTGSSAAELTIEDLIPAGMEYVSGSARWSVSGSTALDDDPGGDPAGIEYDFDDSTIDTATFVIDNVNPGQSGFVRFQVNVVAGQAPGIINNTAEFTYDGSTFNTNTVPFTVLSAPGVTLDGDTIPDANAGSTILFENELTNTGTGTDTFNITFVTDDYPVGTTFQLLQDDGATPMTDSTGNGIPDTGPVAAGGTYTVHVRVSVPSNAVDGTGPFTLTKRATSSVDSSVSDDADDVLTLISGASVDLTLNAELGDGSELGGGNEAPSGEAAAVETQTANPGTTVTFPLFVNNTGPTSDSYNMNVSNSSPFNEGVFANSLPSGWTVSFRSVPGGSSLTNTGSIASGAFREIEARITIPAGETPGARSLYFKSNSPTSGATDVLHVAIDVNEVRSISLQTNNTAQTFPGGSVVYEHILTNTGNVTEGNDTDSVIDFTLVNTPASAGWTSNLFYDADNNGTLDPSDPIFDVSTQTLADVTGSGLAPGESVRLFVRVVAPLGASDGATLATVLTATTTQGTYTTSAPDPVVNTDTTSVVRGDLSVLKEQRVDEGSGFGAFTTDQLTAIPGSTIEYRITVTNIGSETATGISVNDTVPSNTTFVNAQTGSTGTSITTQPSAGASAGSSVVFGIPDLEPTETADVTFQVEIND